MKTRILILLSTLMLTALNLNAQGSKSDAERLNLKGNVKSILETTHNTKHQVVGQPIRYIFNDQGDFEHVHYFDTAGNLAITVHYTYDSKGRITGSTRLLEPYSQLDGVTTYSYDKKNRLLTASLLEINDTTTLTTTYRYNKKGEEIEMRIFGEDGDTLGCLKKEYDTYGNLVRETFLDGPSQLYHGEKVLRYDTEGNVVEENNVDLERVHWCLLYSYSFDSKGNWVTCYKFRVTTREASLYEVVSRQISYSE